MSIYDDNESVVAVMMALAFMWIVISMVCFFSFGNIINGFFNPEYWALKEVLGVLK